MYVTGEWKKEWIAEEEFYINLYTHSVHTIVCLVLWIQACACLISIIPFRLQVIRYTQIAAAKCVEITTAIKNALAGSQDQTM